MLVSFQTEIELTTLDKGTNCVRDRDKQRSSAPGHDGWGVQPGGQVSKRSV